MVFCEAIAYAQSCVHLEELKMKPKQEEALAHLFIGKVCSNMGDQIAVLNYWHH